MNYVRRRLICQRAVSRDQPEQSDAYHSGLYLTLVWLVFRSFKLVRWGWFSGTVSVLIGGFILAVFLAMFNYLTPSGSFVVTAALSR